MFVQTIPKRTTTLDDNRTEVCIERHRIEQSMHSKTCRAAGHLSPPQQQQQQQEGQQLIGGKRLPHKSVRSDHLGRLVLTAKKH
jgi:uncharacterized protein (DUF2252 family)